MQPIEFATVQQALAGFVGRTVYLHLEVTPGGFARGLAAHVEQAWITGSGPYRIALRCQGDSWIRFELMTDYEIDARGRLLLAAHDDDGKLTRALELSPEPFATGGGWHG